MTDEYKAFIREMRGRMVELNLTPQSAAEYIGCSKTTFCNWLGMRTVMSGEDMIRIINRLMEGRYEKRRGV